MRFQSHIDQTSPPPVAFFDMDMTVLQVNSGVRWIKHSFRQGDLSWYKLVYGIYLAVLYRMGRVQVEDLFRKEVALLKAKDERELQSKIEYFFSTEIIHTISRQAREAIEQYRALGTRLVLLTSSLLYIAQLVGEELNFDEIIASELQVLNGKFTGDVIEPPCMNENKTLLAAKWATANDIDLGVCAFYTDSYHDISMLERVGKPVVINPDVRLRQIAQRRGWPIYNWITD